MEEKSFWSINFSVLSVLTHNVGKEEKMDKRNALLDFVKAIAAFGVIFVHFHYMGTPGQALGAIGVTGVIIFFFISGFQTYSADGSSCAKIKRRFLRNLKLLLIAVGVYVVYTVIEQLILGTFTEWAANYAQPLVWIKMLIMGNFDLIHADQLWFMVAMLYAYLILLVMEKYRLHKLFYVFLPFLLLLKIVMETCTNSFSNIEWFDWHFSENFLAGGLPIMLFGNFVASRKDRLLKAGTPIFAVGSIISMVLVFVFTYIRVWRLDITQVFKIAAAFFIFMTCLKLPEVHISRFIETIGRKYSLYIYLYHMVIGKIFAYIIVSLGLPFFVTEKLLPFAVIIASTAVSFVIVTVLAKIANRRKAATE